MFWFWFGLWLCSVVLVHGGYVDYVERLRKAYLRGESSPMYQIMTMLMVSAGDIRAVQTEDRKIEFRGAQGNVKLSYVLTSPIGTFSAAECVVETCAVNPPGGEVLQWQVHTTTEWIFGVIRVAEGNITMPAVRDAPTCTSPAEIVTGQQLTVVNTNGLASYNMSVSLLSLDLGKPECLNVVLNTNVSATVELEMVKVEKTFGLQQIDIMGYRWRPANIQPKTEELRVGYRPTFASFIDSTPPDAVGWSHRQEGVVNDDPQCKNVWGEEDPNKYQGHYYGLNAKDYHTYSGAGFYEMYGLGGTGKPRRFFNNKCWPDGGCQGNECFRNENNEGPTAYTQFVSKNQPKAYCTDSAGDVTFTEATGLTTVYVQYGATLFNNPNSRPATLEGIRKGTFSELIDIDGQTVENALKFSPGGLLRCESRRVWSVAGFCDQDNTWNYWGFCRAAIRHVRHQYWTSRLIRPTEYIYPVKLLDSTTTATIRMTVRAGKKDPTTTTAKIVISGAASQSIQAGADAFFTLSTTGSGLLQVGPGSIPNYLYYATPTAFNRAPKELQPDGTVPDLIAYQKFGNFELFPHYCNITGNRPCSARNGLWNGYGRPTTDDEITKRQFSFPELTWTSGTVTGGAYKTTLTTTKLASGSYELSGVTFESGSTNPPKVQFSLKGQFDKIYAVEQKLTPLGCTYVRSGGCSACSAGFEIVFKAHSKELGGGYATISSNADDIRLPNGVRLNDTVGTMYTISGNTNLQRLNTTVTLTGSAGLTCSFQVLDVELARPGADFTAAPHTDSPTPAYGPTTKKPSSAPSAVKTGGSLPTWAIVLIAVGGVVVLFAVGICAAGNQQDSVV